MNCEFRGSMPDAIAEIAMPIAQTQFVGHVEKLAKTLKWVSDEKKTTCETALPLPA